MKRIIISIVSILLILATLTGCGAITKTFGKEYRLVDDYFEQLEADIRFSVNEYTSTQKDYPERKNEIDNGLNMLIANLKIAKNEMKMNIEDFKEYTDKLGYTVSAADYVEKGLLETRIGVEQKFKEVANGKFTLKHAEVKRSFFGSIWHFVRNHWIITLVILGVVGVLAEKLEEFWIKRRKQNQLFLPELNVLKLLKLRDRLQVC